MYRSKVGPCVLIFCAIATTSTALIAGEVTSLFAANNLPEDYEGAGLFVGAGYQGFPGFTNEAAGQRFVADLDGILSSITSTVRRGNSQGIPLRVGIHETFGLLPGTMLGELIVNELSVPAQFSTALAVFDFESQGINIQSGHSYFVTYSVDVPITNSTRYIADRIQESALSIGLRSNFSRDGGETWEESQSPPEIGLRVALVPEPTILALLILASGCIFARHHRRRAFCS